MKCNANHWITQPEGSGLQMFKVTSLDSRRTWIPRCRSPCALERTKTTWNDLVLYWGLRSSHAETQESSRREVAQVGRMVLLMWDSREPKSVSCIRSYHCTDHSGTKMQTARASSANKTSAMKITQNIVEDVQISTCGNGSWTPLNLRITLVSPDLSMSSPRMSTFPNVSNMTNFANTGKTW